MTSPNEIINTITEAFNAYQSRPSLEAQIKKLQDDLDLARYEIECRVEEERRLEQVIKDLYTARDDLRAELDMTNSELTNSLNTIRELQSEVRSQGHKINEQDTDLQAERIKNKMLLDTQAMLQLQLDDSCSLTHKLRATLTRILGEANEVLPEVKPAATFPVEGSEAKSEPNGNVAVSVVETNRMANEVATEQTTENKAWDDLKPWYL